MITGARATRPCAQLQSSTFTRDVHAIHGRDDALDRREIGGEESVRFHFGRGTRARLAYVKDALERLAVETELAHGGAHDVALDDGRLAAAQSERRREQLGKARQTIAHQIAQLVN